VLVSQAPPRGLKHGFEQKGSSKYLRVPKSSAKLRTILIPDATGLYATSDGPSQISDAKILNFPSKISKADFNMICSNNRLPDITVMDIACYISHNRFETSYYQHLGCSIVASDGSNTICVGSRKALTCMHFQGDKTVINQVSRLC
jgi:hypothetical protein